ncbi:AraC family transcriptional regulator [Photobacterium sp. GJ3]|uniref:AraC family transcriptional regulator n=1 Tax=Photobacterium sp. GJ3 TaxID=2829502 RepID=UPI002013704D|nr:AraC family transcriptional regulator [Photobacterium sp. GJ3]
MWRPARYSGIELLSAAFTQFEFSRHWHDELAIGVIESGAEGLFYRGSNIIVPQQQIVAINPAEIHTGFPGSAQGWRYRMFYFSPEFIARCFAETPAHVSPVIDRAVIHHPELFHLLFQLHVSLESPSLDLTRDSLLITALEMLFTNYGNARHVASLTTSDKKSPVLVRDYLQDHWQDNVALDELAHLCGQTKFKIIRDFKTQYGMTPHQYLLMLKVQRAKTLLRQGQSCADTALACGFFDQSHFTRNFKRAFGVPPRHYAN